jgi:hypothetical protein
MPESSNSRGSQASIARQRLGINNVSTDRKRKDKNKKSEVKSLFYVV